MITATRVIRWGRHYELGIGIIDKQHQHLFELLNRLHDQWQSNAPQRTLVATLSALIESASAHFQTEEDLMEQHGYASRSSHKYEHDTLGRKVTEFQQNFEDGRAVLDETFFGYLADWLRNHVLVTDRPMCNAFLGKNRSNG